MFPTPMSVSLDSITEMPSAAPYSLPPAIASTFPVDVSAHQAIDSAKPKKENRKRGREGGISRLPRLAHCHRGSRLPLSPFERVSDSALSIVFRFLDISAMQNLGQIAPL